MGARATEHNSSFWRGAGWIFLLALFGTATALVQQPARAQASPAVILDIFGRVLNTRGITLTDWDGYLANPAIKLFVQAPAGAALPGSVLLSTPEQRTYFDMPSTVGAGGPTKTVSLSSTAAIPFHLSIFPDRDGVNESYTLTVRFTDRNGVQTVSTVPVQVVDQDLQAPGPFQIHVDFSKDQTGFYTDPDKRRILEQVADDWEYFFDFNPDQVPAQTEWTFIWNPDGFNAGQQTLNAGAYRGFLLYTYGIHDEQALRSGGEGSYGGDFQKVGGVATELRRSGGVEIETAGNFNQLGWFLTTSDSDWWVSNNFGDRPNDLYSIAHHEMGHALGINDAYPACLRAKTQGFIAHPAVLAYHGSNPPIDGSDHFSGVVDRASLFGAFGNEYHGFMPFGRWLITKLDLLCLQAIGYPLRATSAFAPLSFPTPSLPPFAAGTPYSAPLAAGGGIPGYNWRVTAGSLPPDLFLDSFTGVLSGTPAAGGTFQFTVEVHDQDEQSAGISRDVTLTGQSASLSAAPTSLQTGEPLSVSWTVPPGAAYWDWIGLFKVGDPNTGELWYGYTGGATTGTFNLTGPNTPGQYEFRYFQNNGRASVAASNTVTVNAPPATAYSLTPTPSIQTAGGSLTIDWTAPAGSSTWDWIGLFRATNPNSGEVWYAYTNGAPSGSKTLNAPLTPGEYEFRYLLNNGRTDVKRVAITVTAPSAGSYTLTPLPTTVAPGGTLSITWAAPEGSAPFDWIGLFPVGSPNTGEVWWNYTWGATSGTYNLTAPNTPGQYEFRYFANNTRASVKISGPVTVN